MLALLAYWLSPFSSAPRTPINTPAQPYRDNERVVVEKDGSRVLLARWAIGTPDNIATLRIPMPFVTIVGSFGPNYKDPDYQQPFTRTLLVDAALPNFSPRRCRYGCLRKEEGQGVHILVESNIGLRPGKNEGDALRIRARIRYEHLKLGHKYPIVEKPERFGLRCVGPAHDRSGQRAIRLKDFCYSGADPLDPDDFMTCTVLEVPTRDEQADIQVRALCQQWFVVPGLNAVANMRYVRQYQRDWRLLKERAIAFLESFRPK